MKREVFISRLYRFLLIGAGIYFILRLAIDAAYLVINLQQYGGRTDLTDYLTAAANFQDRLPLYAPGPVKVWEFYRYSPFFALVFAPFLWVSPAAALIIHTLLHLPVYALLYLAWVRLFSRLGLDAPRRSTGLVTAPLAGLRRLLERPGFIEYLHPHRSVCHAAAGGGAV